MANPDALLVNIRQLYALHYPDENDCVMLAANIESLDAWLTNNGEKPTDWQQKCIASDGTLTCVLDRHPETVRHMTRDGKPWTLNVTLHVSVYPPSP